MSSKAVRRVRVALLGVTALFVAAVFLGPSFLKANPRLLPTRTPADVGLTFEAVELSPKDFPIRIGAWLVPAPNPKAAIVMVHGGGEDNRSLPYGNGLELMRDLVSHGYT